MSDKLFSKYFRAEDCPECGCDLIVKTECDPANDTDFEEWFMDGDEVNCNNPLCNFKSAISTCSGEAWIQERSEL